MLIHALQALVESANDVSVRFAENKNWMPVLDSHSGSSGLSLVLAEDAKVQILEFNSRLLFQSGSQTEPKVVDITSHSSLDLRLTWVNGSVANFHLRS